MKKKEFKLVYNKEHKTIFVHYGNQIFVPEQLLQTCKHKTLHFEGKYLAFIVCSCGKRWERQVEYSKNTRYTFFKLKEPK